MNKIITYIFLVVLILVGGWFFFYKNITDVPSILPEEEVMQPKEFTLTVQNKKITSGPETITVKQGDTVAITVTADEDEEFHVHGYDRSVDLEKGVPATLSFEASASGRFMFELEESKAEIGALEVLP